MTSDDVLEAQLKHERELRERLECRLNAHEQLNQQQFKRTDLTMRVLEAAIILLLLGQAPTIATFLGSVIK